MPPPPTLRAICFTPFNEHVRFGWVLVGRPVLHLRCMFSWACGAYHTTLPLLFSVHSFLFATKQYLNRRNTMEGSNSIPCDSPACQAAAQIHVPPVHPNCTLGCLLPDMLLMPLTRRSTPHQKWCIFVLCSSGTRLRCAVIRSPASPVCAALPFPYGVCRLLFA